MKLFRLIFFFLIFICKTDSFISHWVYCSVPDWFQRLCSSMQIIQGGDPCTHLTVSLPRNRKVSLDLEWLWNPSWWMNRIVECSGLEGMHEDCWVQSLPTWGSNNMLDLGPFREESIHCYIVLGQRNTKQRGVYNLGNLEEYNFI